MPCPVLPCHAPSFGRLALKNITIPGSPVPCADFEGLGLEKRIKLTGGTACMRECAASMAKRVRECIALSGGHTGH